MKIARLLFCSIVVLGVGVSAVAQEGFPLNGTWTGDYGTSPKEADRTQTTMVLSWDGKKISGLIDPGPDSTTLKVGTLDSTKWAVHLEYDVKDKTGKVVPFVVNGTLKNANSRNNRTVEGTYTHGTAKGDFKIKMDN